MSLWLDFLGTEIGYIETPNFGRTRIAQAGKGHGREALFLMHGIGGHLEAYSKNIAALSKEFHVIAFDFVGHGCSAKRTDIEYNPVNYTEQLRELMDALDIETANLEGDTLGATVAGIFAIKYPNRLRRVIMNTTGAIPIVSEKGRRDLAEFVALSAQNVGQAPSFETVQARMRWLLFEGNWPMLTDEIINTRLEIYSQPEFQNTAPLVFARLNNAGKGGAPPGMIDLERIEAETLLLWTKHNPIHDVDAARAALARLKHGKLYVMKTDAGHWPQFEGAAEHNAIVTRYLKTGQT